MSRIKAKYYCIYCSKEQQFSHYVVSHVNTSQQSTDTVTKIAETNSYTTSVPCEQQSLAPYRPIEKYTSSDTSMIDNPQVCVLPY